MTCSDTSKMGRRPYRVREAVDLAGECTVLLDEGIPCRVEQISWGDMGFLPPLTFDSTVVSSPQLIFIL